MTSAEPGMTTLPVEVSAISADGFRLRLGDESLFVPFSEFPWFRHASAGDITRVERPSGDHLYWPALDIDLEVESIRHPGQFPLMAR